MQDLSMFTPEQIDMLIASQFISGVYSNSTPIFVQKYNKSLEESPSIKSDLVLLWDNWFSRCETNSLTFDGEIPQIFIASLLNESWDLFVEKYKNNRLALQQEHVVAHKYSGISENIGEFLLIYNPTQKFQKLETRSEDWINQHYARVFFDLHDMNVIDLHNISNRGFSVLTRLLWSNKLNLLEEMINGYIKRGWDVPDEFFENVSFSNLKNDDRTKIKNKTERLMLKNNLKERIEQKTQQSSDYSLKKRKI